MLDSFGIGAANAKHGRSVDWIIVSITSSTLIAPMLASRESFFSDSFEISILSLGMSIIRRPVVWRSRGGATRRVAVVADLSEFSVRHPVRHPRAALAALRVELRALEPVDDPIAAER